MILQKRSVLFGGMVLVSLFGLCMPVFSQTRPGIRNTALPDQTIDQPAHKKGEAEQLRDEVKPLRSELERLRALIETRGTDQSAAAPQPSPAAIERTASSQSKSSIPDKPGVAILTKAQGGDLSGAGNLLRTDRITIGGYGDFQFRESSISERADGGGTPTFQSTRFVPSIAAVLAEKQNIVFNSEIEY